MGFALSSPIAMPQRAIGGRNEKPALPTRRAKALVAKYAPYYHGSFREGHAMKHLRLAALLPFALLMGGAPPPQDAQFDAQDRMATLSSNNVHRVIDTATHDSLISGADAEASIQAILDVLQSVRAGTPVR